MNNAKGENTINCGFGLLKVFEIVPDFAALADLADGVAAQQRTDLSLRRAQAVSDYLTTHAVDPEVLRVQGCSTFEPVKKRAYAEAAQAQNRRVEVEATDSLVEERQDQSIKASASIPQQTQATAAILP